MVVLPFPRVLRPFNTTLCKECPSKRLHWGNGLSVKQSGLHPDAWTFPSLGAERRPGRTDRSAAQAHNRSVATFQLSTITSFITNGDELRAYGQGRLLASGSVGTCHRCHIDEHQISITLMPYLGQVNVGPVHNGRFKGFHSSFGIKFPVMRTEPSGYISRNKLRGF